MTNLQHAGADFLHIRELDLRGRTSYTSIAAHCPVQLVELRISIPLCLTSVSKLTKDPPTATPLAQLNRPTTPTKRTARLSCVTDARRSCSIWSPRCHFVPLCLFRKVHNLKTRGKRYRGGIFPRCASHLAFFYS